MKRKKKIYFLIFTIFVSFYIITNNFVTLSNNSSNLLSKKQSSSMNLDTILFIIGGVVFLIFFVSFLKKWLIKNNFTGILYRIFVSVGIFLFVMMIGCSFSYCFLLVPNPFVMWICITITLLLHAIFAFFLIRSINKGYTNGVMTEREIIKGTREANRLREKALPKTPENKRILDTGYKIYLDVQKAWMNYDYDSMRFLVTDELFNTYKSQLEMLEFKTQRNIMHSFSLKSYDLLSSKKENGLTSIEMLLTTSFYGYTVHRKKKKKKKKGVLKGSKKKRIEMTYLLTFVSVEGSRKIEKCPNCGAPIENGKSLCEYCHSNVSTNTGGMRLAKKSTLIQKWEENIYKEENI